MVVEVTPTITAMRSIPLPILFSLVLIPLSCKDSSEEEKLEIIDAFESQSLSKIAEIGNVSDQFWDGFNGVNSEPIFLIFNEPVSDMPTGYFINPDSPPNGSIELSPELSSGLAVYRNDQFISEALSFLDVGTFAFDYNIEGEGYLLLQYTQSDNFYFTYKNRDNNWIPVVLLHELFHVHQRRFTRPVGAVQQFFEYPLTEELIALHLLLWDLMADAYADNTAQQFEENLRLYLAIREEMIRLDQSEGQLVLNMGVFQEWLEGSARYVEYFSALNTIDPTIDQDPTQGWTDFLDSVEDELSVRQALVQRTWYHVGAIVIHMLKSSGINIESKMEEGETPYKITKDFLSLSNEELSEALADAKNMVDWEAYTLRSKEIRALF